MANSPVTIQKNNTNVLQGKEHERTSGRVGGTPGVAVSGHMAEGAGGVIPASAQATNWGVVAAGGGVVRLLNLTIRKKSALKLNFVRRSYKKGLKLWFSLYTMWQGVFNADQVSGQAGGLCQGRSSYSQASGQALPAASFNSSGGHREGFGPLLAVVGCQGATGGV